MLFFLRQGVQGNDLVSILLSVYTMGMLSLSTYVISRKLRNPDHVTVDDKGFTYKFLSITFRVGWEDVDEIMMEGSKEIRIRLHDPYKVAANSLVENRPFGRTRFNPYKKFLIQRFAQFKLPWPTNREELGKLLNQSGESQGYHIAIPVFESAAEAEKLFNDMRSRQAQWRPAYKPLSLTDEPVATPGANIERQEDYQPPPRPREME